MTAEYAAEGESAPGVSTTEFRHALGRFATGVTIVTTRDDGVDHAMTANAFTSVSLDPLLVLVCVEKIARFHEAVLGSGLWAVSILPASARAASVWFATRGRPLDHQVDGLRHVRGEYTGAVIFADALASVECRTHAVYDGGDHSIVVGEVLSVELLDVEASPLLYYGGQYRSLDDRG